MIHDAYVSLAIILSLFQINFAQEPSHYNWGPFTRADSLRGYLSPLRTCYDVTYYHLDVAINPDSESVQGSNTIRFTVGLFVFTLLLAVGTKARLQDPLPLAMVTVAVFAGSDRWLRSCA